MTLLPILCGMIQLCVNVGFKDDWVKSGMPPIDELDPDRPWVKDTKGRHHNLLAILDWPDEGGSDEDTPSPASSGT